MQDDDAVKPTPTENFATAAGRLTACRRAAGFREKQDILEALPPGFVQPATYRTHESGTDFAKQAPAYVEAFRRRGLPDLTVEWLLHGHGRPPLALVALGAPLATARETMLLDVYAALAAVLADATPPATLAQRRDMALYLAAMLEQSPDYAPDRPITADTVRPYLPLLLMALAK